MTALMMRTGYSVLHPGNESITHLIDKNTQRVIKKMAGMIGGNIEWMDEFFYNINNKIKPLVCVPVLIDYSLHDQFL